LADKYLVFFRVLLYLYTVLLFVATLIPVSVIRGNQESWLDFLAFSYSDKLIHFLLFFILTCLLSVSYCFTKKLHYFLIPFGIGLLIECLQHMMMSGRTFEIWDVAANTAGTATAYFLLIKRPVRNDT